MVQRGKSSPLKACALVFMEGHPTNSSLTTSQLLQSPCAPSAQHSSEEDTGRLFGVPSLSIDGQRGHHVTLQLCIWNLNLMSNECASDMCGCSLLHTHQRLKPCRYLQGLAHCFLWGSALFARERARGDWEAPSWCHLLKWSDSPGLSGGL